MRATGDGGARTGAGEGLPAREQDPPDLAVHLLGEFGVEIGGRAIAADAWRLRKAAQLVKLLALTPGHRLHRDQIAEQLWPELAPEAALSNFHQVLFAARQVLEPGRAARSQATFLPLRQQMLALQPAGALWVDVEAFRAAAEAALGSGDPASLDAALALYTGELLPDEPYEEWASGPREALRATHLRLLVELARLREGRGELEAAIDAWERVVAADAAHEEAHVGLMRAHALAGHRQQALRQYQRLRAALARELDAEPEPDSTELYERILGGRFPETTEAQTAEPAPARTRALPPSPPRPVSAEVPSLRLVAASGGFVNHERELDVLQRSLEEALGGRGRAVLIAGDPGIGKSRIVEELVRYAEQRGVRATWGRCYEGEGAPSYWPWIQIIRHKLAGRQSDELREDLGRGAATIAQIVPEIRPLVPGLEEPPALEPAQARFRLFDSVTAFLRRRAARGPLLLVLDDLHWADDSSLRLLDFLAAEIGASPILIAGTYRHAEVEERGPLAQTLARLSRLVGGERLRLGGLDEPGVAAFSELAAGRAPSPELVAAVYRKSEGNPLFVGELVRLVRDEDRWAEPQVGAWLDASLPPQIQEVINLRLVRLAPECVSLLVIASVLGREFNLDLAARIAEVPVADALERLDEAMRAGIVDEMPEATGRFRFSHVLIPDTLYASLSGARRAMLHARAGAALEEVQARGHQVLLSELAHHFALAVPAGEAERAIDYLVRAGERAMEKVAYAEAAGYYGRALRLLERVEAGPTPRRCDVLLALAAAQNASGEGLQARESGRQAAEVARALGSPEHLARAAVAYWNVAATNEWETGDQIRLLEEALAALPATDSATRVRVLTLLTRSLYGAQFLASEDRRTALAQEAVVIARRLDDPRALVDALTARRFALREPDGLAIRVADSREVVRLVDAVGDRVLALSGHIQLFYDLMEVGDIPAAKREMDTYETIAAELHLPLILWSAHVRRAMRALLDGRLTKAERLMLEARDLGERLAIRPTSMNYAVQLFFLRREQDRLAEAEQDVVAVAREYPEVVFVRCLHSALLSGLGRQEAARREAEVLAANGFAELPSDAYWTTTTALLTDVADQLGEVAWADTLYARLAPFEGRNVVPGNAQVYLGPVSRYLGTLAALLGELETAIRHLEAAITMCERMGAPPLLRQAQVDYAALLLQRGRPRDRSEALGLLDDCLVDARRMGMRRLEIRATTVRITH